MCKINIKINSFHLCFTKCGELENVREKKNRSQKTTEKMKKKAMTLIHNVQYVYKESTVTLLNEAKVGINQ